VHAFINDLLVGGPGMEISLSRRANILGYHLAGSHVVVLIELSIVREMLHGGEQSRISQEERPGRFADVVGKFRQAVQERYPGSLIDEQTHLLTCLFSLGDGGTSEQLSAWLEDFSDQMRRGRQVVMAAGIGNSCQNISAYRRSYAEADEALKLGQCLDQENRSSSFNTLGVYRYIYQFARDNTLCDQYQAQIAAIVEYDRRKGTKLLITLESYLECGGNIARTSSQLEIHRNTLLQRLERLQKLCMLDLERVQNRLPLLVAIKVHRLQTCSS
jgi:sugar diacid utilization regulator